MIPFARDFKDKLSWGNSEKSSERLIKNNSMHLRKKLKNTPENGKISHIYGCVGLIVCHS